MFNDLNKMKSFSLNIPVLKETIAKLEISIKNIEKIGTDVKNSGDRLLSESWEGNATNRFIEHQQDWKKGYDETVNQLMDFKESLEKVVLAGAEEINEMASELVVAFGGSQGAGYRDIISMEQEGIEELKAKCKTLVYEDYEEQREIMGRIENLSSKLNYSFSIGVAASKNKRTIEENQEKLQAFKGKLQNYEDRVLRFEQEVVDEMSKYAVICGHKLDAASFREVLKYQKDDRWKELLSKNVDELSDIEKLVLEAEYESGRDVDLFKLNPEDVTREIAEWLIANPVNVYATQHPFITQLVTGVDIIALFYAGGFVMDDDGVYHARQEWSLQSFEYSGYNDFYDTIFHYATSMDKAKFQFSDDDGNDYILWAWKGDYLNLGAGAEMGIYKRMVIDETPIDQVNGTKTEHWLVDQSLAMPMTLTLDYNRKPIIAYDPKKDDPQIIDPLRKSTDKWWVTGFNPDYQDVEASELTATYTVTFNTQAMYDDFYNKYGQGRDKDSRWTFDPKTITATFEF